MRESDELSCPRPVLRGSEGEFPQSTHPYLWTEEGWIYLAGILDLHDRSIVGRAMDSTMKTQLVVAALDQAGGRTHAGKGRCFIRTSGSNMPAKPIKNP